MTRWPGPRAARLAFVAPLLALLAGCGMVHRTALQFPSLNEGFVYDGGGLQLRTLDAAQVDAMDSHGTVTLHVPEGLTPRCLPAVDCNAVGLEYMRNRTAGPGDARRREVQMHGRWSEQARTFEIRLPRLRHYRLEQLSARFDAADDVPGRPVKVVSLQFADTPIEDPRDWRRYEVYWLHPQGQCLDRGGVRIHTYYMEPLKDAAAAAVAERYQFGFETALDGICMYRRSFHRDIIVTDTPGYRLPAGRALRCPRTLKSACRWTGDAALDPPR